MESKKIGLSIGKIFSVLLIFVILLCIFISNSQQNNEINKINNPEMAKSLTYAEVKDEDALIENCEFVQFSTFFAKDLNNDGKAEKIKGTCKNISSSDILYMELKVLSKGYLKNGKIEINGENFNLNTAIVADKVIANNYIENNTKEIELVAEVQNGTQKIIEADVMPNIININDYSANSIIKLTGIYVYENSKGEEVEVPIEKECEITVDWYGTTNNIINTPMGMSFSNNDIVNQETGNVELSFSIEVVEDSDKKLLLDSNVVTVTIPEVKGLKALNAKVTNDNVEYSFDKENSKLIITRKSNVDEDGNILTSIGYKNYYDVVIEYPSDIYNDAEKETIIINVPIESYYTAYNNPSEEFNNEIDYNIAKSNVASKRLALTYEKPFGDVYKFDVEIGELVKNPYTKYIVSKKGVMKTYNSAENVEQDIYEVRWIFTRGPSGTISKAEMNYTQSDAVNKIDSETETEILTNTSNIGIYFQGADVMLGENGYISVYNADTNELLHKFSSEDWNNYSKSEPFYYAESVKNVKVEISESANNSTLIVNHVKEIDDNAVVEKYSKEDFEKLSLVYTYLTGKVFNENSENIGQQNVSEVAAYEDQVSVVDLIVTDKKIATNKETINAEMIIQTSASAYNQAKWQDAEFIIEMPSDIVNMEINSIEIYNNNIQIKAYDLYQIDGKYFIKIITKNDLPESYSIYINYNITPNSKMATVTKDVILYAYNAEYYNYKNSTEDIYDVNNNGNITENVGISTDELQFISPTGLVTSQYVTDYDNEVENEKTDAPNVAEVKKEQRNAQINVDLLNNYSSTISDIKLIGQVPFERNSYIITGKELGSQFDTLLTNEIQLLSAKNFSTEFETDKLNNLKNNLKIYYSTSEKPTKELEEEANNWVLSENVSDWSKIKTYLIDFQDFVMNYGDEITFKYVVAIPEGIDYEKVSFSQHAVYFNLDTAEGKLATYTEPNKLGIRITRKYNLEIQKNIIGTSTPIQNAVYLLETGNKDEDNYESYLGITDSNGKINIDNLNVDKLYRLTEIKSEDDFEINSSTLEFIIKENTNTKELELQVITNGSGYKETIIQSNTVNIKVEDKVRYDLKLVKTRTGTETKVEGITYLITSGNIGAEDYEIYRKVTNKDGEINLNNLYLDKVYTVEEIYTTNNFELATGKLEFKVAQDANSGELILEVLTAGAGYKNYSINDNYILQLNMEDEVRYKLKLNKKDENTNNLAGVQYKIEGENYEEVELTDANGIVEFSKLNINKTYTITELKAEGYYLSEPFEITVTKDNDGDLLSNLGTISDNGNEVILNINLTNEKIPTFNLQLIKIKKDNKDEKLANVTFEITGPNYNKEVQTDENGMISLNDLYQYVDSKDFDATYTITEKIPAEGYVLQTNPLKIQVSSNNGNLSVNVLEGEDFIADSNNGKDIQINDSTVTITLENIPTFKIIKVDESDGKIIANAKFAIYEIIYNEDGTINEIVVATDEKGNKIGELETINGKEYYIVTTDENGEIIANLTEGFYYIEEIQAAEGYELPSEEERKHYFSIGEYKSEVNNFGIYWENSILTGTSQLSAIKKLDNGYIAGGYAITQITLELIDETVATINEYMPFIIKYDENGKALWFNVLNNTNTISNLEVTRQNEIIVLQNMDISKYDNKGNFVTTTSIYDIITRNLNSISIDNNIIKINNQYLISGELETDITTETIETIDGGSKLISTGKFILVLNENLEVLQYYNEQEEEYETKFDKYSIETIKNNNYVEIENFETNTTITTQQQGSVELTGSSLIVYDEYGNYDLAIATNNEHMRFIIGSKINDNAIYVLTEQDADITINLNNKEYSLTTGVSLIKFDNTGNIVWLENGYNLMQLDKAIVDNNMMIAVGYELSENNEVVGTIKSITEYQVSPEFPNIEEIVIENKMLEFKITTEVKQGKGSISGENDNPYETVVYKKDSKLPIEIIPDSANGWEIKKITINGKIIDFHIESDGSVTLSNFVEMTEDKHIAVWFVNPNNNYNFEITKTNENGEVLENAKFLLQKVVKDADGNEKLYDAVDEEGNYVGYKYELNGTTYRVVETDENGVIRAQLPYGNYRITELEAPVGHNISEENTYNFSIGVREISYIEDLVEFSDDVSLGNGYSAELLRTLDFTDDDSYRNPEDTSFGDYNGDGVVEGIKLELTNTSGTGFKPIGNSNAFVNMFDGNGYEIRNIYIKTDGRAGLFGKTDGANVLNIGLEGGSISGGSIVAGIIANAKNTVVSNCYNNVQSVSGGSYAGGIIASGEGVIINKCYNTADISAVNYAGGIQGYSQEDSTINNCYNLGNITGNYAGGIIGDAYSSLSNDISNSYNEGQITGTRVGGILGSGAFLVSSCYNKGIIIGENESGTVGGISGTGRYIQNSVNIGTVNSGTGNGITGNKNITTENYYYNESAECHHPGAEDGYGERTKTYLQSQEFVTLLNEYTYMDTSTWVYQENDFPTMVFKEVDLEEQFDIELIDTSMVKVNFVNNKKEYTITTEILENSEGNRKGGTITNSDSGNSEIYFVENVLYNNDSTINIKMCPDKYFKIEKVIINNIEQEFTQDENGNVILDTFKNVDRDIHVQVLFERAYSFTLIKKNEDGDILPGTKFAIYKLETEGDNIVEKNALDTKGNIVGTLEEINGEQLYVVTSDENGMVLANLPIGEYRIKEVQAVEGYLLENWEKDFTIKQADLEVVASMSATLSRYAINVSPTSDGGYIKIDDGKYNSNNEKQWDLPTKKSGYMEIFDVQENNNGEYYVVGFIGGSATFDKECFENAIEDVTLTSVPYNAANAIMMILNNEGKIKSVEIVGEASGNTYIYSVEKQSDNSYICRYKTDNIVNFSAEETVSGEALQLSAGTYIIHFTEDLKIKKALANNYYGRTTYQNGIYTFHVDTNQSGQRIYKINENGELITDTAISGVTVWDELMEKDGTKIQAVHITPTTISGSLTENGEDIVITSEGYPVPAVILFNKEGKISNIIKINAYGLMLRSKQISKWRICCMWLDTRVKYTKIINYSIYKKWKIN